MSGETPLERREVLSQTVEAIETSNADVIVAAYFDRLMRSLRVQYELVSRVEAAGARCSPSMSPVTNAAPASGFVAPCSAPCPRTAPHTAERLGEAQIRAIAALAP